jgi:aminoglycoside/choline kinase family phosphotransferase
MKKDFFYTNKASTCAHLRAFDYEKFFSELMNWHNYLAKLLEEPSSFFEALKEDLSELAKISSSYEQVLTHRDYHCRNLMIFEDKVYWIDFQDARLGSHAYDVVSLLRDSYVKIDHSTFHELTNFYLDSLNDRRKELQKPPLSMESFREEMEFVGLQRNLKAFGTFLFLTYAKNKPEFLKYIYNTLSHILHSEQKILVEKRFPFLMRFLNDLYVEKNHPFFIKIQKDFDLNDSFFF